MIRTNRISWQFSTKEFISSEEKVGRRVVSLRPAWAAQQDPVSETMYI
jgi:hypothetical protein